MRLHLHSVHPAEVCGEHRIRAGLLVANPMHRTVVTLLLSCGVIAGCAAAKPPSVMDLPATCDSVPEPLARGEAAKGMLPSHDVAPTSASEVLGVVTEARSGRALRSARVALFRSSSDSGRIQVGREVPTDTVGGFVLGPVSPGTYILRVRAMAHRADERPVILRAGAADTVYVQMRYFRCVGY